MKTMTDAASENVSAILTSESTILIVLLLIAGAASASFTGFLAGCAVAMAGILMFGIYHVFAIRNFGGTTGDLAGWFLQMAELLMLLTAAMVLR